MQESPKTAKLKVKKKYNGNASDSDDENVQMRRKVEDKYESRGSQYNNDEKKIINYIIQKSHLFMDLWTLLRRKTGSKVVKIVTECTFYKGLKTWRGSGYPA